LAVRKRKTPQKQRKPRTAPERRPGQPWTIPELARELRVSDQYLYDQIKKAKIKALALDGVFRIADSVAQQMLGKEPVAA
jgi:hypothetical protein